MRNGPYEFVIAPSDYPGKRYRERYCYEHHLVWWKNTGEVLADGEVIHHINHDKRDNRFENLSRTTKAEHNRVHAAEHPVEYVRLNCVECHSPFDLRAMLHRERLKKYGVGHQLCCSKSCQVRKMHRDRKTLKESHV